MGKRSISIFKVTSLILLIIFVSMPIHFADAAIKTFVKEYTHRVGDEDSRNGSRTIALRRVKELLLEELGVYLESQTEYKNSLMTSTQLIVLTAGIVSTELIDEKWDGKVYWLKAKIAVDTQDVIKKIDNLRKDRAKVQELTALRKKSEELLQENERLKKEFIVAKGGAKQETTQAYNQNINNLSAIEWYERGFGLVTSGNYNDAEKAFSKAIELNPLYATAYVNRGNVFYVLGNPQQAIDDFNKAIDLNPRLAEAYNNRGVAYGDKFGNYQQEIQDTNKAIELNPQYAGAYYNRGLTFGKLGNYQQAIQDTNKAIALNPQFAEAYHKRGLLYGMLGNYQQEIKDYNKAIELNPQLAEAYNSRGRVYGEFGNYQQSIEDYKIAARLGLKLAQDFLRSRGIGW